MSPNIRLQSHHYQDLRRRRTEAKYLRVQNMKKITCPSTSEGVLYLLYCRYAGIWNHVLTSALSKGSPIMMGQNFVSLSVMILLLLPLCDKLVKTFQKLSTIKSGEKNPDHPHDVDVINFIYCCASVVFHHHNDISTTWR